MLLCSISTEYHRKQGIFDMLRDRAADPGYTEVPRRGTFPGPLCLVPSWPSPCGGPAAPAAGLELRSGTSAKKEAMKGERWGGQEGSGFMCV